MGINKKIINVAIVLLIFIDYNYLLAENNKRNEYIKKNCEIDKKYFVKENREFIKKILVGEWAALPHSKIIFKEDGQFILIYQMRITKVGVWDVGNNCILLKFKNDNKYNCIEIEYYNLSYENGIYIFEILFKKSYYWGGELYLEFN